MGFTLEGCGFVESGPQYSKEVVYHFVGGEYSGAFGNRLYFLFFETKEAIILSSTFVFSSRFTLKGSDTTRKIRKPRFYDIFSY